MYKNHKIAVVVAARSGSKRLPGKNTKLFDGKPLIAYAIEAAMKSKYADRVIFSTDSQDIAAVAKSYDIAVPFIRPPELAGDRSTITSVLKHAVSFLEASESLSPDIVVLVQPTNPFVISEDIDRVIEKLVEAGTNSCVTICEISERPEWMYKDDGVKIMPVLPCNYREARVQDLPKYWRISCSVYANKKEVLTVHNKILDFDSLAGAIVPRERFADIDEPLDFIIAEAMIKLQKESL